MVNADSWIVHEVDRQIAVQATRAMPLLSSEEESLIETIWQTEQARLGGILFNGLVFCADRIRPERIEGHWTEYRRLVGQFAHPVLFERLHIRSLAVNGILLGPDGVVLGQRPALAVYQPGLWQLAPAGSLDPTACSAEGQIDVIRQVATELREEVGISFSEIAEAYPIALVEHPGSHVCDLGIVMTTGLTASAILAAHHAQGDCEYSSIRVIGHAEIERFAAVAGQGMAQQSRIFLERLGWLPDQAGGGALR